MITINVKTDISKALAKIDRISDGVKNKATVRALNKTAAQVKVQAAREIRDAGYNIKIAKIKKSIDIYKANSGHLVARIRASGKPISLMNYGARQIKAGVSVNVKNGRKIIKGAFIATMPNGHVGVFVRHGNKHKKVGTGKGAWHGLPIEELFGPSIPSAFMSQTVQKALDSAVREKFPGIFKHELEYLRIK